MCMCVVWTKREVLACRASAALRGARRKVAHVHGRVEAGDHSVDRLIQPRGLNQICGSQLLRRYLNDFNVISLTLATPINKHKTHTTFLLPVAIQLTT